MTALELIRSVAGIQQQIDEEISNAEQTLSEKLELLESAPFDSEVVLTESAIQIIAALRAILNNAGNPTRVMSNDDASSFLAGIEAITKVGEKQPAEKVDLINRALASAESKANNSALSLIKKTGEKFSSGKLKEEWEQHLKDWLEALQSDDEGEIKSMKAALLKKLHELELSLNKTVVSLKKKLDGELGGKPDLALQGS